jgi:hypothetical protein
MQRVLWVVARGQCRPGLKHVPCGNYISMEFRIYNTRIQVSFRSWR